MLNFGHTLGHSLENVYELSHGQAVAIGMAYASIFSGKLTGFMDAPRVIRLIEQFGLPADMEFDAKQALDVMRMDKKRERTEIHYVLLEKIGKGVVRPVQLKQIEQFISA